MAHYTHNIVTACKNFTRRNRVVLSQKLNPLYRSFMQKEMIGVEKGTKKFSL